MVKDTLNSVFDNLKERATNPFLGTLIVVWLIKNWKLVYSLFYFDSQIKLEERLKYIDKYFKDHSFLLNMVFVILITLGVLILTYGLLTLSRLLTDFYERIVIPWISKITDKSTVVLKVEYKQLLEEVKGLETRLDEERLARIAAQNERDSAYSRLVQSQVVDEEQNKSIDNGEKKNPFQRISNHIIKYASTAAVNSIIQNIQNKTKCDPNDLTIRILLQEDLINRDPKTVEEGRYIFTDDGKKFIRYWNDNHS